MTWAMHEQGQNASSYYTKVRERTTGAAGAAFRQRYPEFKIVPWVPPDCPQDATCGPALFNQCVLAFIVQGGDSEIDLCTVLDKKSLVREL